MDGHVVCAQNLHAAPSEKRILSLHFMAAILSHRWDSSLLSHQLAKRLCVTCVMFLFGTEFGLCVLLRCQAAFLGRKAACTG